MDFLTGGLGVVMVLYGMYTLIARFKSPEKFSKLEAMKEKFGNALGLGIHILAYTIMPCVLGAIFIYFGIKGISLIG